jgi:hypothetical protein
MLIWGSTRDNIVTGTVNTQPSDADDIPRIRGYASSSTAIIPNVATIRGVTGMQYDGSQ